MHHFLARSVLAALMTAGCALVAGGLLMLAATGTVQAETGNYLIDVWTGENGLPNSSVTAIAQTPDGYLWVGTYNGLARFDGVRFVSFDPLTTPELANARVRRLFVDESGALWVNTFDGSLTSFHNGKFKLEWKGDGSPDAWVWAVSLKTNRLVFLLHTGELIARGAATNDETDWTTLQPPGFSSGELAVEDRDGIIWCRGRDQKLWRFDGGKFEAIPADSGLQGQTINCLVTGPDGCVWAGTEKKMARWEGARFVNQNPTNGEPVLNVLNLSFLSNGDAWVFADGRVRKARGRQWLLEPEECRGVFAGRLERLGVQEDRQGGSWIYHYGKGLFHVRADGRTRQMTTEEGFPGDRVDCVFADHEGNLWAGVDRGGLVRLRERLFKVLLPDNDVAAKAAVSVSEDSAGSIWVGTFGGGLFSLNHDQWQRYLLAEGPQRGFVFSVIPAGDERLWVSAGEEDLFLFAQGKFQAINPPVHGIKSLLMGNDGRLWIGTKSGLICWTNGRLRQYQPEDGVDRVDIRALAQDAKGRIWAGGGNGTLYCIETNKISSYRTEGMFSGQPIWSLLPDRDGSIWVGTFRGGLLCLHDGHFVRYTSKNGLPDDVICQLLDDNEGWLWGGSSKGIFRVAKSELHAFAAGRAKFINSTAYGRFDGLPSLECSGSYQPACWRASDGRLLFATLKGVVAVHPEEMAPNLMPPPVYLEEALVDGVPQAFGQKKIRSAKGGESNLAVLELSPGKHQLELRYTGLSFVSPDRVRFRYQLEGLDTDWVEAGTRRTVQYSFLRPGQYTFHVIACNNDGIWNTEGAKLLLNVLPRFYETAWFMALMGFGAMGLVAITVRQVVVRKMRRQLEILERQRAVERDRTRIAKDIHDDIGAGLTQITLLTELARRDPAQTDTNLGRITDSARKLTRAMDEIVWAVDPQHDTVAGLMDYISAYAEDYLRVAEVRCRMDLPLHLPATRVDAELRYNLFLALKEALNNIVKHAEATEVWLRLRLEPASLTLIVEDNGQGITTGSPAEGERLSSGSGLGNLEKRLAAVGGRCQIHSVAGQGTRVEMTVFLKTPASSVVAIGADDPIT